MAYLDDFDDQNVLEYGINDAVIPKSDSVIVFTITQFSAANRAWIFSKACNFIEYFWNNCSGKIINFFSCRRFPDDFIRGHHFSIEPGDLRG